jgi:hypothetical protein
MEPIRYDLQSISLVDLTHLFEHKDIWNVSFRSEWVLPPV